MALRKTPLVNGQIYHIFNRSIDRKPIFIHQKENQRAFNTLSFYRFSDIPVRLSYFLTWSAERKDQLLKELEKNKNYLVKVLCFCLMPNHFHFLLSQEKEGGISKFVAQFQNSYTRYLNIKYKRKGHLFEGQFKAVRVETDEQLVHLSRYIHLNPYSLFVVKQIDDLFSYSYSSLQEYLGKTSGFCDREIILSHFKNLKEEYKKFIFDQADYQREIERIKHLTLEE